MEDRNCQNLPLILYGNKTDKCKNKENKLFEKVLKKVSTEEGVALAESCQAIFI